MSVRARVIWGRVEIFAHRVQPQKTRGQIENRVGSLGVAEVRG